MVAHRRRLAAQPVDELIAVRGATEKKRRIGRRAEPTELDRELREARDRYVRSTRQKAARLARAVADADTDNEGEVGRAEMEMA